MSPLAPRYEAFVTDKYNQKNHQRFFSADSSHPLTTTEQTQRLKKLRVIHELEGKHDSKQKKQTDYQRVDDNHGWMEQEFNHLSAAIKDIKQDNAAERRLIKRQRARLNRVSDTTSPEPRTEADNAVQAQLDARLLKNTQERDALVLDQRLCLYYAILLLDHASGYGNTDKIKFYQKEIKTIVGEQSLSTANIVDDLVDLIHTPLHTSRMRDMLGLANIYRLQIVFSRLTWKESWLNARNMQWLDQFDNAHGVPINIGVLDAPTNVFNVLSVGLFASRFMINLGLLLKHTFDPTEAEKGVAWDVRLWRELDKRGWGLVNDLVWSVVNALTNYAPYFHIAGPVAGLILSAFLAFDALWLGFRLYWVEHAYLEKKGQYTSELMALENALNECTLSAQERLKLEHDKKVLIRQMDQLELGFRENKAGLLFAMAAAILLMVAFTSIMVFSAPFVVPVCFFLCTLAVAMYMSAGKFGMYMKENLHLDQDKARKIGTGLSRRKSTEQQSAWTNFVSSMVKNMVMPLLIIGLFTISWPAAVVFAALYIGYECGYGYISASIATKPPVVLPAVSGVKSKLGFYSAEKTPEENDAALVVVDDLPVNC